MASFHPLYLCCRGLHQAWDWMLTYLTPLGFGVVGMAIASAGLGFWSTQGLCHLLFFLSVALLILALIGRRFIQLGFQAERHLPRFGTVGEALNYRIALKNLTVQSQTGLVFTEDIQHPFLSFQEFCQARSQRIPGQSWITAVRQALSKQQWAIATLVPLPKLKSRGTTEVNSEIIPLRRGQLRLENLLIKASDPLGLSYQCLHYPLAQSICILPQRYRLPDLFSSSNQSDRMGSAVLTQAVGESTEFRALRDYRPGDPTNKIHWKSWAKLGQPVVREHQQEASIRHGLLLDTFALGSEGFEEMVAIAISILMQPQGESELLDVIFASEQIHCFTAGGSPQHKENLLERVATLAPCEGHTFQDLMPLAQDRFLRWNSCVVLLIQWDEQRHNFLERLAQGGIPTKAFVICERHLSHQGLRYMSLSHSCTVYFISIGQIQQDLWEA